MNFVFASRLSASLALALVTLNLASCGSEFTCADSRTCTPSNQPDGAAGTSGSAGTGTGGTTAGASGSGGTAGSSGGSAGSSGGSAGTGDAATDGSDASDAGSDADSGSCATGTEGCACTPARGCNTGLICRGALCVKTVCGDSRIEGSEFCDDGQNLGAAVGDCAPDCTATVVQKKIVVSATFVQPDFGKDGPAYFMSNLDRHCPAGYKALFSNGVHRIATVAPNVGDGQKDWPLRPWTRYVNAGGAPIWLTNTVTLLGVVNGTFVGLTNPVSDPPLSGDFVHTGMNQDWTVLLPSLSCTNWTSWNSSAGKYVLGFSGETSAILLREPFPEYTCGGTLWAKLYCVEQ